MILHLTSGYLTYLIWFSLTTPDFLPDPSIVSSIQMCYFLSLEHAIFIWSGPFNPLIWYWNNHFLWDTCLITSQVQDSCKVAEIIFIFFHSSVPSSYQSVGIKVVFKGIFIEWITSGGINYFPWFARFYLRHQNIVWRLWFMCNWTSSCPLCCRAVFFPPTFCRSHQW